ncbi:MAG TPA: DUF4331 family protein [Gemmatimonadaceae bacterium]|nr:DUF4331 family protein [Gemmatimonadaceae bacterium]
MRRIKISNRTLVSTSLAAVAVAIVGTAWASDHQQSRITELNPQMDITDIYAFPGAGGTDGSRVTLVMNTASPIVPARNGEARFDHNLLYQFKIDNSSPADGVEDLVIQVTFDSTAGNNRVINVRGPTQPLDNRTDARGTPIRRQGTTAMLVANQANQPRILGRGTDSVVTTTGTGGTIQVFAGLRDDPFFVDLEQFFRIIPDRKPVTGPLAAFSPRPTASSFRFAENSTAAQRAPFDQTNGPARDFLTFARANTLAIVLEFPVALVAPGANKKIGVWGTISR